MEGKFSFKSKESIFFVTDLLIMGIRSESFMIFDFGRNWHKSWQSIISKGSLCNLVFFEVFRLVLIEFHSS